MGLWRAFLSLLRSMFFKQEMEFSLIGLQNAGKTSLVDVVAMGGYSEDMIPTVGFNTRKVTKGKVTIKLWDVGGQPMFRSFVGAILPFCFRYCANSGNNGLGPTGFEVDQDTSLSGPASLGSQPVGGQG